VSIVILNWNNPEDTLACLQSMTALNYSSVATIVVDNGSSDDSVSRIGAAYSEIKIIKTGKNLGYAGGNNVGIRYALAQGAEYICILNNDVTVSADFLTPLIDALQSPAVGVVTPLIAGQNHPSQTWALGSCVNWRTATVNRLHIGEDVAHWRCCEPIEVEIASGAAMLIKRAVFEQVGLLDEDFFLYYEETDWCLHVKQAGFHILAVPEAIVWHAVSATLGETSPVIDYYMLRNHLRLIVRHWHGSIRLWLLARTIARDLLTIAAYTVKSRGGRRRRSRNARLLALRDAARGRWGEMGPDVEAVCR
jgi:GT2 family glycosyltransferase